MNRGTMIRSAVLAVAALALVSPLAFRGTAPPLLLNLTESLPGRVFLHVDRDPRVGDVVAVCLPEELARFAVERQYVARGRRCPSGASPLLKHVAALAGAEVRYEAERMVVDGVALEASAIRQRDSHERAMPVFRAPEYVVAEGEVLLLNTHPLSFDSRYFGPVRLDAVLGVYRALTPTLSRERERAPAPSPCLATSPSLSPRAQRGAGAGGHLATPPPAPVPRAARDDNGKRMRVGGKAAP